MNFIEIRYLRHGLYREKTKLFSDVAKKPSETTRDYILRIVNDGNITDEVYMKHGGRIKDKGLNV
jgi:hypothetical protein